MQRALTLYQTTIGKKAIMAASGAVLVGFVLVHWIGNLQLFSGPQKINEYAAFLHGLGGLLWVARFVLLASVGAHIWAAVQLAGRNSEARASSYRKHRTQVTNYAAQTMYWSGPILLLFIVYHLAHLTFGFAPGYEFDRHNVYNNVVYGFQIPWVSIVYIAGNLALAFHLYHGVWSMLQTIGATHPKYDRFRKNAARGLGLVVAIGNISFPIAVLAGLVEPTMESFYFPELAQ